MEVDRYRLYAPGAEQFRGEEIIQTRTDNLSSIPVVDKLFWILTD